MDVVCVKGESILSFSLQPRMSILSSFLDRLKQTAEIDRSESDELQIYFGLPYIPRPQSKSQYAHIFTPAFRQKTLNRMLRVLKSQTANHQDQTRHHQALEHLTRKSRRQESEIRKLEEDYGNILQLSLELMDLLQASVQGEPVAIGNDIFERLSARLVSRPTTAMRFLL